MKKKESSKPGNWEKKGIGIFSNTLPNYIKWTIILCITLILISFFPVKVLLGKDYRTDEYIKSWQVGDGEKFTIWYTHSVQLTPVTETYRVEGDKIILTDSFFYSLGAGLPSITPYKFRIREGGFEIYDIDEELEYLVYRTGAERANHKIIFEDDEYDFLDFSKARTGIKFEIDKIPAISYILKEVF